MVALRRLNSRQAPIEKLSDDNIEHLTGIRCVRSILSRHDSGPLLWLRSCDARLLIVDLASKAAWERRGSQSACETRRRS